MVDLTVPVSVPGATQSTSELRQLAETMLQEVRAAAEMTKAMVMAAASVREVGKATKEVKTAGGGSGNVLFGNSFKAAADDAGAVADQLKRIHESERQLVTSMRAGTQEFQSRQRTLSQLVTRGAGVIPAIAGSVPGLGAAAGLASMFGPAGLAAGSAVGIPALYYQALTGGAERAAAGRQANSAVDRAGGSAFLAAQAAQGSAGLTIDQQTRAARRRLLSQGGQAAVDSAVSFGKYSGLSPLEAMTGLGTGVNQTQAQAARVLAQIGEGTFSQNAATIADGKIRGDDLYVIASRATGGRLKPAEIKARLERSSTYTSTAERIETEAQYRDLKLMDQAGIGAMSATAAPDSPEQQQADATRKEAYKQAADLQDKAGPVADAWQGTVEAFGGGPSNRTTARQLYDRGRAVKVELNGGSLPAAR